MYQSLFCDGIGKNGHLVMSCSDMRNLAEALSYIADEAEDHNGFMGRVRFVGRDMGRRAKGDIRHLDLAAVPDEIFFKGHKFLEIEEKHKRKPMKFKKVGLVNKLKFWKRKKKTTE